MRYQDLHVNGVDFAYMTNNTIEEVESPGYFDHVHDRLRRLDYIRITADIRSDTPALAWFRVHSIEGNKVTMTRIGRWDVSKPQPKDREPSDPDRRAEIVISGMRRFMEKYPDQSNRDFYTQHGLPDARLLQPFTGFTCSSDDRDLAWSIIQSDVKQERMTA